MIKELDCKATDLKKKLDLLRHESTKCQNKMKKLAEEYHTLLHRDKVQNEHPEICFLENQIHRVEMNLMEAEHVRKKYRIIRGRLLDDSVEFESTLVKMEEAIQTQESEIKQLKVTLQIKWKMKDIMSIRIKKIFLFVLMGWSLLPYALWPFKIYYTPSNLGITKMPIKFCSEAYFFRLDVLTLKSQTRDPQIEVPPRGLVLRIFTF